MQPKTNAFQLDSWQNIKSQTAEAPKMNSIMTFIYFGRERYSVTLTRPVSLLRCAAEILINQTGTESVTFDCDRLPSEAALKFQFTL